MDPANAQSQLFDRLVTSLPGGGLNFGDRALDAFGYFCAVYITALPVAAVMLATLAGGKVSRARRSRWVPRCCRPRRSSSA